MNNHPVVIQGMLNEINRLKMDNYVHKLINQNELGKIPKHPTLITVYDLNKNSPLSHARQLYIHYRFKYNI